jgi:hypothetical protein
LDRYDPSETLTPALSTEEKQKVMLEKYKKYIKGVTM